MKLCSFPVSLGITSMPVALCNMLSTNSDNLCGFLLLLFYREEKLKKHDVSGFVDYLMQKQ